MKISKELMAAIRATCKVQRDAHRRSTFNHYEEDRKAAANLLANNKAARRDVARAMELKERSRKLQSKASALTSKYGLADCGTQPGWTEVLKAAFVKAGGKIKLPPSSPRRAESIIAELAGATEAQGKAIITGLGIKW